MARLLARLAPLALGLLCAVGCGSPCQDLADRICNCQPSGTLRDSCKSSVKNQIDAAKPTSSDQSYCSDRLKTCPDPESTPSQCQVLETQAGKEACGLAFPETDGGVTDGGTQ
jgi:hypothetical protein